MRKITKLKNPFNSESENPLLVSYINSFTHFVFNEIFNTINQ